MLKTLRWQLTVLYLLGALGMVVLMGAGTYLLLNYYLQQSTDLALEYKMALQFRLFGFSLPSELAKSEQTWLETSSRPLISPTPKPQKTSNASDDHSSDNENKEDGLDSELSPVYAIPLDAEGNPVQTTNPAPASVVQDVAAVSSAIKNGYDLRTTTLADGRNVRLLTYPTGGETGPAVLQVGRELSDQERLLKRYLGGLMAIGGASSILLALASWWLAGRSLGPAQKAWDQQQTFVSNASHELRTPLTLVRASADYGLRTSSAPEQAKILADIVDECDYMSSMVDDLLLLSRLDAKRLQMAHENIPVHELLAEIQQKMALVAEKQGINLTVEAHLMQIKADSMRMRQVLLILMDNAMRFTPAGGTIILGSVQMGKWVEIFVKDSGKGIPPEHLPHLFERFYQVRTNAIDDSRSNGLGLSIARGLIEAQGGSIKIESEVGRGTKIRIKMPSS